jgi:hypothetical protein
VIFAMAFFASSVVSFFLLLASIKGRREVPCFSDRLGIATALLAGAIWCCVFA